MVISEMDAIMASTYLVFRAETRNSSFLEILWKITTFHAFSMEKI